MEDTESHSEEKTNRRQFQIKLYEGGCLAERTSKLQLVLSKAKPQNQQNPPKICKKNLIRLKDSGLFFKKPFIV